MSHRLIDSYLAELRRSLPARLAGEAADGLLQTYEHHLAGDAAGDQAARAAVAEFGEPALVIGEFARQAPGRHAARVLLATGPGVGACWAAALLMGRGWAWPIPSDARLLFGSALVLVIGALAIAATSRRSYRRTRLAALACPGLAGLDSIAIAAVLLSAPALTWPLAIAVAASLTRVTFALRSLPRI